MATILGFDPSLTSSGFAYTDEAGEYHTGRIRANDLRGSARLDFIEQALVSLISKAGMGGTLDLLVYEGYAMAGKTSKGRLFDIGELGGVLKLLAWRAGIDVLSVPPSNLKQFATGSGRADKPAVTKAIAATWGYKVPQDDEADAFVLHKMGEAFLSSRKPRQLLKAKALAGCVVYHSR